VFFFDVNRLAGPRVASYSGIPFLDGKGAKSAQLNPVALCHGTCDFIKDGIDDALYVALVKMWIIIRNFLDEFRPDHSTSPRETIFTASTIGNFHPYVKPVLSHLSFYFGGNMLFFGCFFAWSSLPGEGNRR
jgi:hypothetical protein